MAEEPTSQAKQVRAIYSIMNGIENNIGGGEGVEGLYGSITGSHMQRMLAVMREHCGLDSSSHLVDVGAGLGRPLIHALVTEGISGATGIELDYIKCMKADAFLKQTAKAMLKKGITTDAIKLPVIECKPVEKVRSLDPATHAYSFWEGVPIDARVSFGRLFAASRTLRSVTVVQRSMRTKDPEEVMEHGYAFGPVNLVQTLAVSMSGSNRHFTAYIFNKAVPPAGLPRRRGAQAAEAAAAEVEEDAAKIATPPLSGNNAKLCSKTSDSAIDALSKKLNLAEVEVASPIAAVGGGGGSRTKTQRPSKKRNQTEIDSVKNNTTIATTKQDTESPKKKARTSTGRQNLQNQRPILAALAKSVHVIKHSQQQQKNAVKINKKQKSIMTTTKTAAAATGKQSPTVKLINREARGLFGDGGAVGLTAAALLEGSNYPRTRHAIKSIS